MAHYAFLDEQNIVTSVIVGLEETDGDWETFYGSQVNKVCKRTSRNTYGGIHYDPNTGQPSLDQSKSFRKNYAFVGGVYDFTKDAFISPKPFKSWVLDETTCIWLPPIPMPPIVLNPDGTITGNGYEWDDDLYISDNTKGWVAI